MHDSKDTTVAITFEIKKQTLKPSFWSPSWIYKQSFDSLLKTHHFCLEEYLNYIKVSEILFSHC